MTIASRKQFSERQHFLIVTEVMHRFRGWLGSITVLKELAF